MVFSSSIFLFFFLPLVVTGYYLLREKFRVYFLLLGSLFFYAWGGPRYLLVMLLSIAANYIFGLFIHTSRRANKIRLVKVLLVCAVVCNLGILFYYKYFAFTINTFNRFFGTGLMNAVVMPIGISFFTFQGLSYVIDLYRGQVPVQKNPALTAFYISFFPQLIAGPIVRYTDIVNQIYNRRESVEQFTNGVRRFIVGLAKKVIIANNLGFTADLVFANTAIENTAAATWLGIICYAFQIYFDFSGYSDMAIGLGKMFGFDFLENFNYPYIAKTLTEFWRRWHISLSTWFRDYVYIPLGGNKRGNVYANLFIVFALTGFWHGAGFNFLAWGLWHGFFLIIERLFTLRECKQAVFVPIRRISTLLIVLAGWVFFRSPGMRYALKYLGIMFGVLRPENAGFTVWYYLSPKVMIVLALALVASTPVLKTTASKFHGMFAWEYVRDAASLLLLCVSLVFAAASSYNPFIYFRF